MYYLVMKCRNSGIFKKCSRCSSFTFYGKVIILIGKKVYKSNINLNTQLQIVYEINAVIF